MNTQIAGSHSLVGPDTTRYMSMRKVLLACGIFYLPLYFASHILAGMQFEGYNHFNQQVSELSAIGAPSRPLLTAFNLVFLVLGVAFGMGVWMSAGHKRSIRFTAIALWVFSLLAFVGWYAPMNPAGAERTATDTAHLVFVFATVVSAFLFIGFGSGADGKWFRIYSILTIVGSLIAGAWVGSQAASIGAGLVTPGLGELERVTVYSPELWMMVLASVLWRAQPKPNEV